MEIETAMEKIFKKIGVGIKWLYNRKRNIGIGIALTSLGLQAFVPGVMTPEQFKFVELTGGVIAGWGLAHNVTKNSTTINNAIKKAQKLTNKKDKSYE